jgi:hypothetical protein
MKGVLENKTRKVTEVDVYHQGGEPFHMPWCSSPPHAAETEAEEETLIQSIAQS